VNPLVKSIFTKKSRISLGKDALTSSLATLGAFLLYRPIKFLLSASFSDYLNLNSTIFTNQDFSHYLPGFGLLITITIETLFLFSFSLFLYHRFTEYSEQGKVFKKILIITAVSIFYVFYDVLLQHTDITMIPHYISRISGLIMFLLLVKYFWKNNPLSHLFGLIIYFQFDKIINFIQLADPTIKSQGWIVVILLLVLFIYSVGIETVRSRFSSSSA